MAELNALDFNEMINTSVSNAPLPRDVTIILRDEEGMDYDIQDVKYDKDTDSVIIKFNHDNEDYNGSTEES